jgi:hypothetical protein
MLGLMKIWFNFNHLKVPNKSLIMIFEGNLSHKSLLLDVTPYIESL